LDVTFTDAELSILHPARAASRAAAAGSIIGVWNAPATSSLTALVAPYFVLARVSARPHAALVPLMTIWDGQLKFAGCSS
jgi:hypothetical protein